MSRTNRRGRWIGLALALVGTVVVADYFLGSQAPTRARAATGTETLAPALVGASGLPVPRFASLKTERVNVRKGPSRAHPVAWQFQRAGLPVEIIRESENWRMIRDSEGEEGWVYHSLLSGARTAVVAPWDRNAEMRLLWDDAEIGSTLVAEVEPEVIVHIERCDGRWCEVDAGGYRGWMEQAELWGVYVGEAVVD